MDTTALIAQLTEERDRLDAAIKLLSGDHPSTSAKKAPKKRGRRKMSAAARKRISDAQKARWAKARAAKK